MAIGSSSARVAAARSEYVAREEIAMVHASAAASPVALLTGEESGPLPPNLLPLASPLALLTGEESGPLPANLLPLASPLALLTGSPLAVHVCIDIASASNVLARTVCKFPRHRQQRLSPLFLRPPLTGRQAW